MTLLYIDGINDLHFQNDTVRGTLVVLETQFENQAEKDPKGTGSVDPTVTVAATGTVVTTIRGAVQIHAALDELIKKLVADKIIQTPNQPAAALTPKLSAKGSETLN